MARLRELREELFAEGTSEARKKQIRAEITQLMYRRFPDPHQPTIPSYVSYARDVDPFAASNKAILGDRDLFHENSQTYLAHLRYRMTDLLRLEHATDKAVEWVRQHADVGLVNVGSFSSDAEIDRAHRLHQLILTDVKFSNDLLKLVEKFLDVPRDQTIGGGGAAKKRKIVEQ